MLVIRDAFFGVRRFDDFQASLGIARNVLSSRLRRLVDNGILERSRYLDRPVRHEYLLTPKGQDLYPVVLTLLNWGDTWMAGEGGPPVRMTHRCGRSPNAQVICGHCRQTLDPAAVVAR